VVGKIANSETSVVDTVATALRRISDVEISFEISRKQTPPAMTLEVAVAPGRDVRLPSSTAVLEVIAAVDPGLICSKTFVCFDNRD
jgi:hypothetical protein